MPNKPNSRAGGLGGKGLEGGGLAATRGRVTRNDDLSEREAQETPGRI